MTKNIVYGIILSPYARKVYLTLEFKGVPYEAVDVRPHDDLPAFRATSYLGKVPGFEDDTVRISDSSVICDYLEHKYPTPALYPKAAAERAQALWLEEYADTRLQDLLLHGVVMERVIKPSVYAEPSDEQRLARILDEELPGELDYLEEQIGESEFFVGGSLSIADIAIVTTFINAKYADFVVDHERWPRFAAYLKRMYELPLIAQQMTREADFLRGLSSQD